LNGGIVRSISGAFLDQRARGPELSSRPRVVDLNHRSDIGAGEFEFRNDRRPEHPALLFGALDKFVELVVKFSGGIFGVFRLTRYTLRGASKRNHRSGAIAEGPKAAREDLQKGPPEGGL
jgi:hypothetical protein